MKTYLHILKCMAFNALISVSFMSVAMQAGGEEQLVCKGLINRSELPVNISSVLRSSVPSQEPMSHTVQPNSIKLFDYYFSSDPKVMESRNGNKYNLEKVIEGQTPHSLKVSGKYPKFMIIINGKEEVERTDIYSEEIPVKD